MFFYAPEESCGVTKKFFCRSPESCDGIKRFFSMAPELKPHCIHPENSAPRSPAKAPITQPCLFPRPDGSGGFRDRGWCRRMKHGGFGNRYGEPAVFSPANALPAFAGLPCSAFTWDCGFKDEHAESGNPLFPLPPGRSCDFLTAFASKAFPGNVPMRKLKMTKPVLFALPASCEPIERNDCLRVNHPAHRSAM